MIKLMDILAEVGEGTAPKFQWQFKSKYDTSDIINIDYEFTTDKNVKYFVKLTVGENDVVSNAYEMMVAFGVGRSVIKKAVGDKKPFAQVVNKGELFRVMATVMDIVRDGLKRCEEAGTPVKIILFKPEKEKETKTGFVSNDQRLKLYKAYIDKNSDLVQSTTISPFGGVEVILK
jgi:hypothetical protein